MKALKYQFAILLIVISFRSVAQHCDAITGHWLNKDKQVQINIYKKGSQYSGNIVWLKSPHDKNGRPLTDIHNIHPGQRKRTILNLEILSDFICQGNKFTDGNIYDPRRGKSFKGEIKLNGNRIIISAMMGMFAAGTETWTRGTL